MELIALSRGMFAAVDDDDAEELSRFNWTAVRSSRSKDTWYAIRMARLEGPRQPGKTSPRRTLGMHAHLTGFRMTDHIDGDGLNNQRSNLRPANWPQNMRNRRKWQGSSKFKGVHFFRADRVWRAAIRDGLEQRYLGRFHTEEEAALAYDAAARELFGEYGTYNFPQPGERSALTGEVIPRA